MPTQINTIPTDALINQIQLLTNPANRYDSPRKKDSHA